MAKKRNEESNITSSSSGEEEAKEKKNHKKRETSNSEEESSEEEKKPKRGKNKDSSEESSSSSDDRKSKKKNKRKTSSSDSSSESSESFSSDDNKRKGGNKPSTSRLFEDYEKLKEDLSAKFERIFQAKNNSFEATKKREMEELRRQKEIIIDNANKELVALQKERELVSKLRLELEEQRKNDKAPVALGDNIVDVNMIFTDNLRQTVRKSEEAKEADWIEKAKEKLGQEFGSLSASQPLANPESLKKAIVLPSSIPKRAVSQDTRPDMPFLDQIEDENIRREVITVLTFKDIAKENKLKYLGKLLTYNIYVEVDRWLEEKENGTDFLEHVSLEETDMRLLVKWTKELQVPFIEGMLKQKGASAKAMECFERWKEKNGFNQQSRTSKEKRKMKKKPNKQKESSVFDEYAASDEGGAIKIINNFLPQEVNIVLLGGTGVGKSTFINSIANMLSHSTLEDAMMDLHVLIRTSFHHISDNHEQRQIVMEPTIQVERQGEADNEDNKFGESYTKYPRFYVFNYGRKNERTLRIIDTPGVGDMRGVEQDRENLRHTINFVSSFREIHAFLFLMKPNDARLELQFRYCIKELLMHLHVSTTNNIIFTFTNGRGTNYKPSETINTLQALLNSVKEESGVKIQLKDRCVVFDNESYRYLCECQYGIEHKDWEVENYKKSWTHGKKEFSKMLEMIAGFEPHDVNNTLSVNKVRRAIEIMARPLAELAKNLLINMQLIEEKEAEIEECLKNKKNFEDRLFIQTKKGVEVVDRTIQEALASTNGKKKVAEDFLIAKRTERDALERNLQRKQTICAHFAIFLKDSSILAYNDQYLAYLNAFIREERGKVNRGANGETLARLESYHAQYKELKKVFDNPVTGRKMTTIEIEGLIEEIKTMDDGELIGDVHSLEIFWPAHKALDAPAIKIKQKIFKRVIKDGYNSAKKKIIKETKKKIWDKTTKRTTRNKSKH